MRVSKTSSNQTGPDPPRWLCWRCGLGESSSRRDLNSLQRRSVGSWRLAPDSANRDRPTPQFCAVWQNIRIFPRQYSLRVNTGSHQFIKSIDLSRMGDIRRGWVQGNSGSWFTPVSYNEQRPWENQGVLDSETQTRAPSFSIPPARTPS